MLRIPSTLKLTDQLIFSAIGAVLLAVAILYAGRTVFAISAPPSVPGGKTVSPVEQTISKALDLLNSQTSSD